MKVALIRGQFLNQFDMQSYLPLKGKYKITVFGSRHAIHTSFPFPTKFLLSPTDLSEFPKKMSILNRLFIDANYLFGLERELKGYDIAHTAETYSHYTHQAINAKRKGYVKKVFTTVWENIPHNNEGIWGRKAFKKQAMSKIDHFVAVSELSRKALIAEGVDPDKISIIHPGISTSIFFPEKEHFAFLGKRKKEITILFVGRLEIYKGVLDILSAARLLRKDSSLKDYVIKYIFVGHGSQKENMKQISKRYGLDKDILYMSADYSSMPEVYTMADIFIAPSKKDKHWMEQYGMMLLEAQAAGLPIVTTTSGAIPENVGDAAVLVPEGNVKEIAKGLKEFILSPALRVKYGKKAFQRAKGVHDVVHTASKIDTLYTRILKK